MNKWRVSYGIHRGTFMSRDTGSYEYNDEESAVAAYDNIIKAFQPGIDPFGHVLWFAHLYNPENEAVKKINGYPYRS